MDRGLPDALGDPTADDIWALAKDRPAGISRTEVRDLFSRNKKAREIDRARGVLVDAGRLERAAPSDGRGLPRRDVDPPASRLRCNAELQRLAPAMVPFRPLVSPIGATVPVPPPPNQPNYSEVRQAEDQRKYAEEQHRLRKREEEERRKAVDAANRQKNPPAQQK